MKKNNLKKKKMYVTPCAGNNMKHDQDSNMKTETATRHTKVFQQVTEYIEEDLLFSTCRHGMGEPRA